MSVELQVPARPKIVVEGYRGVVVEGDAVPEKLRIGRSFVGDDRPHAVRARAGDMEFLAVEDARDRIGRNHQRTPVHVDRDGRCARCTISEGVFDAVGDHTGLEVVGSCEPRLRFRHRPDGIADLLDGAGTLQRGGRRRGGGELERRALINRHRRIGVDDSRIRHLHGLAGRDDRLRRRGGVGPFKVCESRYGNGGYDSNNTSFRFHAHDYTIIRR